MRSISSTVRPWLDACRPKTLPLACMSILVGSALALSAGSFSWPVLALSFWTAGLLQVLSNLANDYGDGLRGVDDSNRLGPVRALQSGMLTPAQLRLSLFVVAVLAVASGLWLIRVAGLDTADLLVFTLLGVLSIIAALTYTLGRKPYGYAGLGDVSVWLFFGCLGVLGSYYLHGAALHASLLLPASACGFLAAAVLNVNNMRDIDNDRSHGKYTLAVRLGLNRAQLYHQMLLLAALLLFFIYLAVSHMNSLFSLPFLLAGIPVHRHAKAVRKARTSALMAPLLPAMVGCSMLVNGWFCLLLLLQTLLAE